MGSSSKGEESSVRAKAIEAEEKALQEILQSRQEEMGVAQQARERMAGLMTSTLDHMTLRAARLHGDRAVYQKELDYSCSPLLGSAWLGVVEERMAAWQDSHTHTHTHNKKVTSGMTMSEFKTTPPTSRPLTKAVLLGASPPGTALSEVVGVAVYRSRVPVDLSSCLQQCPQLRTITLTKSGVETLVLPGGGDSPHLTELNMPVCEPSNDCQVAYF